MVNADVFLGLSKGGLVSPKMLKSMAPHPVVFALANPDPEIEYDVAIKTREDIIMGTGRSDYPNQVNNILGFPYIFRGALDVRATGINEEMKIAAVYALAELTKQPVPEQVIKTYNVKNIEFGKDYVIPKPFDHRLITEIPPAVAKAAMDSGIAKEPIKDWDAYKDSLAQRLGTGSKFMRMLIGRAKSDPKSIIFAEADHLSVLKAAQIVYEDGIGKPILMGNKDIIHELMKEIKFDVDLPIIDPKSDEEKERRERFAKIYWEKRQRKGVTLIDALGWMRERNYFAAMMVNEGEADALVTGYSRSYPAVAKPMIELIGKAKGVRRIAAANIMLTKRGPIFFSDTAINIDPNAEDLANIGYMTSVAMEMFGFDPVLAMLSFSNFGSSESPLTEKVSKAVDIMHRKFPKLIVDGEIQADFALNSEMLKEKFPFSKLNEKKVNGLIFPNLEAANIGYKLMKEFNQIDSIGPIILGLKKPVHIIQLGASVDEIVNIATVAIVHAQDMDKNK
jgi:malate dehydrogenase (oxaloacetate-decarboxylating)(NADP+)